MEREDREPHVDGNAKWEEVEWSRREVGRSSKAVFTFAVSAPTINSSISDTTSTSITKWAQHSMYQYLSQQNQYVPSGVNPGVPPMDFESPRPVDNKPSLRSSLPSQSYSSKSSPTAQPQPKKFMYDKQKNPYWKWCQSWFRNRTRAHHQQIQHLLHHLYHQLFRPPQIEHEGKYQGKRPEKVGAESAWNRCKWFLVH